MYEPFNSLSFPTFRRWRRQATAPRDEVESVGISRKAFIDNWRLDHLMRKAFRLPVHLK